MARTSLRTREARRACRNPPLENVTKNTQLRNTAREWNIRGILG